MSQIDLKTLVEEIHKGNEAAFHEFYNALSDRVFAYLIPRVHNRDEALDALQEIFLALWSARLRFLYVNDASVYGFVFTIARRTLAKHYESRRKSKAIEERLDDERYDMDIDMLGDVHTVERALPQLSEKDQHIVTLRYWNGLSFAEIAEIEQSSENAIRVRHHRALEKLRAIIETHQP